MVVWDYTYCTFHRIMHESHLRHRSVVAGGLVHPPSVRARKPARGLFSDYLHSVGVGIRCPSDSVRLDTWVSLWFSEIDVRQRALDTYSMSCSDCDDRMRAHVMCWFMWCALCLFYNGFIMIFNMFESLDHDFHLSFVNCFKWNTNHAGSSTWVYFLMYKNW